MLIVRVNELVVAVAPLASVTRTVTVWVDGAVGVPLITPVDGSRDNPLGSAPVATANVYGEAPPDLLKVSVYAELNVPVSPLVGVGKETAADTVNDC